MPRGPYQGTFQPNLRPTVVTAPDALVLINGEPDLSGCPKCKRKFDLSNYITSIQVDLNIDSPPGSATISLSVPRHSVDDFFFDGNPIICPMMEVEIFSKGYYVLEGLPQYYPIFWGLVTEVSDNYSGGEHTITITCSDILKWWELCRMNIHPAYTAPSGQLGKSIFGNVLFGMNPYDVIYTMAQMAFGDVVIGTGSLTSIFQESSQAKSFNFALSDIMLYWADRFTRIRNNLLLYGINGTSVRGDSIYDTYKAKGQGKSGPFASAAVRRANGGDQSTQMVFDPTDPDVVAFRTQFTQAGEVNLWQNEFQTKLEIANAAKEAIGFELYMDVTGDIVFKPPFYNLDIISNKPVSWIQDIDIIDWNFSESEAEVVTQLQISGSFQGNTDYGFSDDLTPNTSVTDYHLLRKYGWRPQQISSEFMASPVLMFYHGLDIMDRLNARRFRGSVTIPHRPELRLGFPIYIAPKDEVWYVTGISHNIAFGGRATTSITCTAKRKKFIAPQGIGSLILTKPNAPVQGGIPPKELAKNAHFDLDVGGAAQIPNTGDLSNTSAYEPLVLRHPKTGRVVGYPNAVMVYTRPFAPTPDTIAGIKKPGTNTRVDPKKKEAYAQRARASLDKQINAVGDGADSAIREKYHNNRYSYGLNSAGAFVYAYEKKKAINQFLLMPAKNITVKGDTANGSTVKFQNNSALIRPVSDERGFEVIGHFRYGRGVSLQDGSLIANDSNAKANVGVQVALGGGLSEVLNAQSQGLTTITSSYPNPAATLSTMQPEDLQTAAVQTPSKELEFTKPDSFVDSSTLGSPEQKGVTSSVEVSQLSRALTLTEMTIKTDSSTVDEGCECLLGRADLAFINVGYQVRNIGTAAPATSSLSDQALDKPVKAQTLTFDEVRSKVEGYLFKLYAALDGPHQEFEQSLRGKLLEQTKMEAQTPLDLFAPPPEKFGNFEPPFSTINRAALGDPQSTALQAQSAAQDIAKKWDQFGQKLKNNAEKARLTAEIANDQSRLSDFEVQLQKLQEIKATTGVVVGDIDSQIAALQQKVSSLQQEIKNDQTELAKIQQSDQLLALGTPG